MTKYSNRKASGSVRIIAGKWRGSKLEFSDADGLRPTSDRIRETLFNWLANDIADASCLDLFAGSGVLSFEALSRGAEKVCALENNRVTCQKIGENKARLSAEGLSLLNKDTMSWLDAMINQGGGETGECFDIVFIDPPFSADFSGSLPDLLEASAVCGPGAKIYLEQARNENRWQVPNSWQLLRDKEAGQVRYSLYQRGG